MKTQKSAILVGIFTALAVLGLLFAACGDPPGGDNTVAVTGVTLDIPSKTIPVGEDFTLTATVEPSNATNKALSWSSSDDGIASVVNGVVTAEAPGDATITVTTEDGSFTETCAVTVTPLPTSIEITTPPTKTLYKIGEELDLTDLVVTASYEDEYPDDEIDIELLEISGFNSATIGDKTITVSYIYDNDLSDTFTVSVLALTKIEIIKSPDIVGVGEPLDLEEIEVEATWGDDSTEKHIKETVTITMANISGFNKDTAGSQTVTVTYEGKPDTFNVLVLGVTAVSIDTEPTKKLYKTGETLDLDGLEVKATFSDDEERTIEHSALNISGFSSATAGEKTITITYSGESDTFTVTVIALTKIVIDTEPTKTLYKTGETLDITGLVVKATWGDDSTDKHITETVTITTANITGFNSATAGQKTLTVTYGGQSKTFTVTVFQQLATPSNLQTGVNLTWSAVSNASSYTVDINGTEYQATGNSYPLSSLTTPATYTMKVKAVGNGTTYTDSEWSSTINYIIKQPTSGLLFTLIDNNTAYSVSRGTATAAEIVIPPVYNGLPVTTIPNGTSSGGGFYGYTAMTSITIPNSVTSIGSGAFNGCSGLESITIPFVGDTLNGTTYTNFGYIFGTASYYSHASYIPASLKTVIIIGGSSIGSNAFYSCSGLTSVTIGGNVTSIGNYAFYGCSGLTSVTIPDSVTSIGNYAFAYCSGLTSVIIGNSVTSIDYMAFYNCSGLTTVFYGGANNAAWSGITMGSWGNDTLTSATRYYYSATNPGTSNTHWRYVDGAPTVWGAAPLAAPSGLQANYATKTLTWTWTAVNNASSYTVDINGTEYTIAANSYSLSGLTPLITYIIKVKAIGNGMTFTNSEWSEPCEYTHPPQQLATPNLLIIGSSLSWSAVSNASGYTVDIDGTEYTANTSNYSLLSLTTPKTYAIKVKTKGNGTAYIDSEWSATIDYTVKQPTPGLAYTAIGTTAYSVTKGTATAAEIVIPPVYNGLPVTSIPGDGFRDYTAMTSVTIPDSVTSIGSNAFRGCNNLTSITIPFVGNTRTSTDYLSVFGFIFGSTTTYVSGATNQYWTGAGNNMTYYYYYIPASLKTVVVTGGNIGYYAFNNCNNLTSVTIGNNVTSIGDWAFQDCNNLTSITIPDSVTSIWNSSFRNCSSLTTVFYCGADNTAWSEIAGNSNKPASAILYYYSQTQPAETGNFWRYVGGVPTVW